MKIFIINFNITDNQNTPACTIGDSEKYLLSLLKDIIESPEIAGTVKEAMSDLWDKEYKAGDYKNFVLKMLARTKSPPKKKLALAPFKHSIEYEAQRIADMPRWNRFWNKYK